MNILNAKQLRAAADALETMDPFYLMSHWRRDGNNSPAFAAMLAGDRVKLMRTFLADYKNIDLKRATELRQNFDVRKAHTYVGNAWTSLEFLFAWATDDGRGMNWDGAIRHGRVTVARVAKIWRDHAEQLEANA